MHVVILAGGGGTRLWPISRTSSPKHLQSFIGRETLLQKTFYRVRKFVRKEHILIATNVRHASSVKQQLRGITKTQLSLEPVKRDTAAAIGLAAIRIAQKNPHATIVMANADHIILEERAYQRALATADKIVRKHPDRTVLLGIEPTYPETGYGYIQMGKIFSKEGGLKVFVGKKFIEKPPLKKAQTYIQSWEYVWNPAMFVWRVDHLLELFRLHLPVHHRHLMTIAAALGTRDEQRVVNREYAKMPSLSIDYGIMEKVRKMLVIPVSIGWADIGHWRTVHEMLDSDPIGNTVRGKHIGVSTRNSLIFNFSDQLVATAGLDNCIVVVTKDAVLVCDREHAQEVKKIVEQVKKKKWLKYL